MGVCVDCGAVTEGRVLRCKACKLLRDAARKATYRAENNDEWQVKRKEYYENNKESIMERIKGWCSENKEKVKEYRKTTARNCSERIKVNSKKYYQQNQEKMRESNRLWNKNNRPRRKAIAAKYRAASLQASVPWANQEAIASVYKECLEVSRITGILHHVDHIVPLQGKLVCGLHNEFNLGIIPAKENLTKSNKFEV